MVPIRQTAHAPVGTRRAGANTPSFVTWALRWLKRSEWRAVPTDKDGVICLIAKSDFQSLIRDKAKPPQYREIPRGLFPEDHACTLNRRYVRICKGVCKVLNIDSMLPALLRSLKGGSLFGAMNAQVKTHKPAGEVSVLLLHSSVGQSFVGLSKLFSVIVSQAASKFHHLCRSTSDFVSKLKLIEACVGDKLMRLDIDNFYMEGKHETLVKNGFRFTDFDCAEFRDGLDFLLSNQLVFSQDLQCMYQVERGSGMGSCHSGDISDMVLYALGERPWALDPNVMSRHAVKGWLRYRDDIFLVIGGSKESRRLYSICIYVCIHMYIDMY